MINEAGLLVVLGFLVVLPSVFIVLAVNISRRRTLFWTIACLLYPCYLLLPFLNLFSAEYEQGMVLEGVYGFAMLTSGPGGIAVSSLCGGFTGNFPADNSWLYFIILLAVVLIQMIGLWFLGKRMLRNKYKPLGKRGFILIIIFFGMFVFGFIHVIVWGLHHS
jgi:hypothetical protein